MSGHRTALHTDIPTIFRDLREPGKAHFPRFVAGSAIAEEQQKTQAMGISEDTKCSQAFECYKLVFARAGQVRVIKDGKLVGCMRRQSPNL